MNIDNIKRQLAETLLDAAFAARSSMPLQVLNFKFFAASTEVELREELSDDPTNVIGIEKVLPSIPKGAHATPIDVLDYLVSKARS